MSTALRPGSVKFFVGLLFHEDYLALDDLIPFFEKQGHGISFESPLFDFTIAQYYSKEMGDREKLKRCWLFFEGVGERQELSKLKSLCNKWEVDFQQKFEVSGRVVNIDPGFIALEQVVLATGKPYSHRIYLGPFDDDHIYAELTYTYQQKKWEVLPWTYPDYCEQEVKSLFSKARSQLASSVRP